MPNKMLKLGFGYLNRKYSLSEIETKISTRHIHLFKTSENLPKNSRFVVKINGI